MNATMPVGGRVRRRPRHRALRLRQLDRGALSAAAHRRCCRPRGRGWARRPCATSATATTLPTPRCTSPLPPRACARWVCAEAIVGQFSPNLSTAWPAREPVAASRRRWRQCARELGVGRALRAEPHILVDSLRGTGQRSTHLQLRCAPSRGRGRSTQIAVSIRRTSDGRRAFRLYRRHQPADIDWECVGHVARQQLDLRQPGRDSASFCSGYANEYD